MDSPRDFEDGSDPDNPVDDSVLSLDELKAQLRQTLRDKGVESGLRADFRSQLIAKLKINRRRSDDGELLSNATPRDLRQRLQDSIVAEYLEASGFRYTLSVFLPESGVEQSLLSPRDVMFAMRMSPWAHQSTSTQANENTNDKSQANGNTKSDQPPVLTRIVGNIAHSGQTLMNRSHCGTQTDDATTTPGEQLERKLQAIHDDFSKACQEAATPLPQTLEERMLRYQSDCDKRAQQAIESEVERIRTLELGAIRAQERSNYKKQLETTTEALRQEYAKRVEKLRRREQEVDAKLAAKSMEIEGRLHADRQENLRALDELKRARAELKRAASLAEREAKSCDDAVNQRQRALDRREKELNERELQLDAQVDSRVRVAREQAESTLRAQQKAVQDENTRLERLAETLEAEKSALDELRKRTSGLDKTLIETQRSFAQLQETELTTRRDNERLKTQLEVTMQLLQRSSDRSSELELETVAIKERLNKAEEAARLATEQQHRTAAELEQVLADRRRRSHPGSPASKTTNARSRLGGMLSVDGVSMSVLGGTSWGESHADHTTSPTAVDAGATGYDDDEEGSMDGYGAQQCHNCESFEYRLRMEEIERRAAEEEVMKLKQLLREHRARLTLVQPFVLDPTASAIDLAATRALESTDPTIQLHGAVFANTYRVPTPQSFPTPSQSSQAPQMTPAAVLEVHQQMHPLPNTTIVVSEHHSRASAPHNVAPVPVASRMEVPWSTAEAPPTAPPPQLTSAGEVHKAVTDTLVLVAPSPSVEQSNNVQSRPPQDDLATTPSAVQGQSADTVSVSSQEATSVVSVVHQDAGVVELVKTHPSTPNRSPIGSRGESPVADGAMSEFEADGVATAGSSNTHNINVGAIDDTTKAGVTEDAAHSEPHSEVEQEGDDGARSPTAMSSGAEPDADAEFASSNTPPASPRSQLETSPAAASHALEVNTLQEATVTDQSSPQSSIHFDSPSASPSSSGLVSTPTSPTLDAAAGDADSGVGKAQVVSDTGADVTATLVAVTTDTLVEPSTMGLVDADTDEDSKDDRVEGETESIALDKDATSDETSESNKAESNEGATQQTDDGADATALSWIERQRSNDEARRRARLDRNRARNTVTSSASALASRPTPANTDEHAAQSVEDDVEELDTDRNSLATTTDVQGAGATDGAEGAEASSSVGSEGVPSPKDEIMDQYLENARRKVQEAKQQQRNTSSHDGNDNRSDDAQDSSEGSFELSIGSRSNSGESDDGDDDSYF
jgi:hypothetical protein